MSGIAQLLRDELKARGWTQKELADKTGLTQAAISKIMSTPDMTPELKTLALFAAALGISMRRLIEACGFPVEASSNPGTTEEQIRAITSAVPELRALFLDLVNRLTPEDRDAMVVYLETMRARRGIGKS